MKPTVSPSTDIALGPAPRWTEVACEVADAIREHPCVTPSASRTQVDGPGAEIYTEWSAVYPSGREVPVLRETRYPGEYHGNPDRLPCEHHVPTRVLDFGEASA